MLKHRIIPCLDVKNGKVVKGINFKNLVYAGDPVEQAKIYDKAGADELCFLDITASSENRKTLLTKVKETAKNCSIPLTVGGGIRSISDVRDLLLAGADKISINTAAIKNNYLIKKCATKFGSQCIVIAIDVKKDLKKNYWEVFSHGGRINTGINALDYAKKVEQMGAGELLITSMDRDGTKTGYDISLIRKISEMVKIPVIASGGVGTLKHLYDGLKIGKASAVLAASIFHFGSYSIFEAKRYLLKKGIPIRI